MVFETTTKKSIPALSDTALSFSGSIFFVDDSLDNESLVGQSPAVESLVG